MKKIFLVFIMLCCAIFVFTNFIIPNTKMSFSEHSDVIYKSGDASFTEKFNVKGQADLSVSTSGGSITVIQGESNEVQVDFIVKEKGKLLDVDLYELKKLKTVDIDQDGNNIEINVKSKSKMGWDRISVSFIVYAPKKSDCSLNTSGGSLSASDIDGNMKMNTSGGSIKLENINGVSNCHTSGGSIKVENHNGKVSLNTSGGSIKVNKLKGNLFAHTSGGSIKLTDIAGAAEASTSGGSIHANFNHVDGDILLKTTGGNIYSSIPATTAANIELRGSSVNGISENFEGTQDRDYVKGSINNGGYNIKMKTSGGRVELDFF